MKKEIRMEAHRFEDISQSFPSHFHEHYVIGVVEKGECVLSCRDREYSSRFFRHCTGVQDLWPVR